MPKNVKQTWGTRFHCCIYCTPHVPCHTCTDHTLARQQTITREGKGSRSACGQRCALPQLQRRGRRLPWPQANAWWQPIPALRRGRLLPAPPALRLIRTALPAASAHPNIPLTFSKTSNWRKLIQSVSGFNADFTKKSDLPRSQKG